MHSICVFCGSSSGNNLIYQQETAELGKELAENNIRLVYGGAKVGLMGTVADACLKSHGRVVGILPDFLSGREIAHHDLSEIIIVQSMHERKEKMYEMADGFIALPGGFGTLEELSEILTWAQLGLHKKPIGILNINNYYDYLDKFLDNMVQNGFLSSQNRAMVLMAEQPNDLFELMKNYQAPEVPKWLKQNKT